jgi:predicted alpha-1,6-mannanase (GH76 family)
MTSFLPPSRLRALLRRLVTASITVGGILGLVLTALPAAPAGAATTPAASAIATLMQSYNSSTGLIDPDGWWQSAVALSTVETYEQTTGDTSYDYAISGAFTANQSGDFEDQYLDDTGWWALAWVQAYDITGDASYLQMAETDANYIHGYWDSTCGGGIWWSTAKTYKNAIENELFLELAAELHNRIPGDTTYLGWADSEWSWFSGSGLINGSHLVDDGLTSSCQISSTTNWTYNQGVILTGLASYYQATGNSALLTTAESIANAAIGALTINGILVEPCEPNCGADGPEFKGIFVRDLREFATIADTAAYNGFFQDQAASIEADDTNSAGQIGLDWSGPVADVTATSQASGAAALVAALPQADVSPVEGAVTSGMSGKCLDDFGDSTANGAIADLWDCNGTGAQQWTVSGDNLLVNGNCLDIIGAGSTANGTLVDIWTCNSGANQDWVAENGTLVNPQSGKCLDDPGFSTTDGTQLDIWSCNGGVNQQWALP